MVQSLTEPHTEAAQAAHRADRELDRRAWNLPRTPLDIASSGAYGDALDWDSFRDLYYPDTRRHNLAAIVAYGDHRSTARPPSGSEAVPVKYALSARGESLGQWEDEGGALRDPSTGSRGR